MKLIRYGPSGTESPGLLQQDGIVALRSYFPDIPDIGERFFADGWLERIAGLKAAGKREDARWGSPIALPSKIICLGKNYKEHAQEGGMEVPAAPLLFCKTPNTLNGPFDPVIIPRSSGQVDWEVELALVIGRSGKAVSKEKALDYIAGITVMNDVSAREAQFADSQWYRGKSFDTFAPLGPCLVTMDEFGGLGDLANLRLAAKVNGRTMQEANTGDMIFDVATLIAYISRDITLSAGDIIATGTPAGVGIFREPPVLLKHGDEVECWIEEIGTIRNRFVDPSE